MLIPTDYSGTISPKELKTFMTKINNVVHMYQCSNCKWYGEQSEVPKQFTSKGQKCPGCGKKWMDKRPGENFRRSVLTSFGMDKDLIMTQTYSSALLRHLTYQEQKANPALRKGQAMWNVAVKQWPNQVEPLRATSRDCFYNDKLIPDFIEALNNSKWD